MNELKYIDEFRKILADYTLSDSAKQQLADTNLLLLVGPTSSGKNTIINELVNSGDYHYIVSDTTRKPRMNNGILEQNGREYWFRAEEDMLTDLRAGEFLEAAVIHNQQVSGISIRELAAANQQRKIAINEVETVGADVIHTAKPEATFIFVVPPSFEEWITRMRLRGELPADEIKKRLESTRKEFAAALQHDYYHIVVNDNYMLAAKKIRQITENRPADPGTQMEARSLVAQLLADTERHLATADY
jgi:guanylate kinase